MKNPPLARVDPSKPNPHPSASLGEAGARLWQAIHADYVIEDAGGHEMLLQICSAADSLTEYSKQIERDGATIKTRNGLREHPLIKYQLAARSFVVRSLHRLGLDIEPTRSTLGRPPGVVRNK